MGEGVKLADAVKFARVSTVIVTKTTCASACFIVFSAGNEKYVGYGARVGVHGASTTTGQETADSRSATIAVAKIVKDLGVPPAIIGQMVVTPPDQMVWLSTSDLQGMGVTMVGKPVQTADPIPLLNPSPEQTRGADSSTGALSQSAPMAVVLPQDKNSQWSQIVSTALETSKNQRGGAPDFRRVCQPELKLCNTAIVFKGSDGNDVMVRKSEDVNEKMLSRDICTFNAFGDVRKCIDWDTGVGTKEMKNAAGEWLPVAN